MIETKVSEFYLVMVKWNFNSSSKLFETFKTYRQLAR
jgi:hypothetical protein